MAIIDTQKIAQRNKLKAKIRLNKKKAAEKRKKKTVSDLMAKVDILQQQVAKLGGVPIVQSPSDPLPKLAIKLAKIKKSSEGFYQTVQWKRIRYQALVNCGAICQCCGASKKTGAILHVDHIKPRSLFPNLALDINNLQVLCEACNMGKFNTNATDWRDQWTAAAS